MKKRNTKQLTVYLHPDDYRNIKKLARKLKLPMSTLAADYITKKLSEITRCPTTQN